MRFVTTFGVAALLASQLSCESSWQFFRPVAAAEMRGVSATEIKIGQTMETKADVTLEKVDDGFAITSVHLTLRAKIPGADDAKFQELAGKAKAGCPVSKLLNTRISLDAALQG